MNKDTRNVIDKYKGKPIEDIVADLDRQEPWFEIAIDNVEHDFNMGTIVRSANAFGVRHVHVIGRRQWNKRGAMMTDKYLHVHYHQTIDEFLDTIKTKTLVAVDNVSGSVPVSRAVLSRDSVLLFGAEGPGIRSELIAHADEIVAIEQFGSTRSINVGVAAGVAMYAWLQRNVL
ncbi:MAG: TrmH family RNA methyltransferase [Candidatus Saccharimonas sp.]